MNLPYFDTKANEATDANQCVCFVIKHIEQNNQWLKHIEENGTNGKSLQRFSLTPELNICTRLKKIKGKQKNRRLSDIIGRIMLTHRS